MKSVQSKSNRKEPLGKTKSFFFTKEKTDDLKQNNESFFPVKNILQRKTGDEHNLKSAKFKGNADLEACYDGDQQRYLHHGSSGESVRKVQEALIESGYPLPIYGADGKFGNETGNNISRLKSDNSITPSDPVVGQKTIAKLDEMMENKGKDNPPNLNSCLDSSVSQEKEPLPDIPIPTVTRMKADEMFELIKKKQTPGHFIPTNPPLGATIPELNNVQPAKAKAIPIPGENCFQCVAEWEMVKPKVDIFIATGTFSDEPKRFFASQQGSVSGCPVGVSLKEVKKVILPEAEPKILDAELEHWSDFVFSYLFVVGRYLSNIRRLTPSRSHLKAQTEDECSQKVDQFILETTIRLPVPNPLGNFGDIMGRDLIDLYHPNTDKRDKNNHSAISKPPKNKLPVFPNIDTDINPFGCGAYFRKFDKDLGPGVPGPTSMEIIEDVDENIPPLKSWHSL